MTPDQIDDQAWSAIERRVTQLEEALRLTVEYVGIQTLRPFEGWSWYDALHSCDWFPEWLARMPGAGPTDAGPAMSDAPNTTPEAAYVAGVRWTNPRPSGEPAMSDDDDRTPMTRTELAMLWDLAGRWIVTHPDGTPHSGSRYWVVSLRDDIDAELTRRFGG